MARKQAAWAALRARVIARNGGRCESCDMTPKRLDVHHRFYEAGKKKWEYDEFTLDALCPRCHGKADELRRKLARAQGALHTDLAMRALGYMQAVGMHDIDPGTGRLKVLSFEHALGIGDAYRIGPELVLRLRDAAGTVLLTDLSAAGGDMWERP